VRVGRGPRGAYRTASEETIAVTLQIQTHRVLFAAALAATLLPIAAVAEPPSMEERIERLVSELESARVDQHIPGMAIAVVKDDEIILARGFGVTDIERETPATPETIFAIGSTTKAFTATVIGMLVDEGMMSWEDRASKYLPTFQLKVNSEHEGDEITIRDMLCHRSGFTRMSMLFISGEVPREEIILTANGAEPLAKFREKFLYNNVMFMAAGMCAGAAADSSWEELIRSRIFTPLGMDDSTLTYAEAQADARLSKGYSWTSEAGEWDHQPMRKIDFIGPAGSINSNVLDMAQWLRFQLGRGEFEGTRLMSEDSLDETWTKQISIAGDIGYGMGWMLREWNGRKVVEHGGNIDGFAAAVAMLPEENLGFVLLTNTSFAPLQQGCISLVFDAIAGEWEAETDVATGDRGEPATDLAACEGVFVANYAHFEDEKFTVALNDDGNLTLHIPSQTTYTLGPENDKGRRPFVGFPQIAASFDRAADGSVPVLRLYQGGVQFEVPREGYEYPIEIPLEELAKYLGKYHFAAMNSDLEVMIRHNHLAVDVPGQTALEFNAAGDGGVWQSRSNDIVKIAIQFNEDEYGNVESMTFNQMGQAFELPRVAATDSDLPTLEQLFALCRLDERRAALERAGMIVQRGSARFAQSGINGTYTATFDAGERFRTDIDLGRFGFIRTAFNVDRAWMHLSFDEPEELEGSLLERTRDEHPALQFGDWRKAFDEIRIDRAGDIDGRKVYLVKVKRGDEPQSTLHIDAETGDVLRVDARVPIPEIEGVSLPVTSHMNDWREVAGIRMPHEVIVETEQNGRLIMKIESLEANVEVDPAYFAFRNDG